MRASLALALLLAACASNPRVVKPYFVEPELRATAARYLDEALGTAGRGISEVRADESTLHWHEMRTLTDKRTILVQRDLALRQVRTVSRPEKDGIGWTLRVDATGGLVVFNFKDDQNAAKAEVAFRRLQRPD